MTNQTPDFPLFFLSFANSSNDPLPFLEKESENIYRCLSPIASQKLIQIHREEFANIDNTSHYLLNTSDRVVLFHYGGHADSKHLIFSNEQLANAEGVAYQLSLQTSLKLVFLNGCSTKDQVATLMDYGIPAVIATSVSIDDSRASKFAEKFYAGIANHLSLQQAFEHAAAVHQTSIGERPGIYRDIELREIEKPVLPWGLYVKNDDVLNEKLIPPNNQVAHKSKKGISIIITITLFIICLIVFRPSITNSEILKRLFNGTLSNPTLTENDTMFNDSIPDTKSVEDTQTITEPIPPKPSPVKPNHSEHYIAGYIFKNNIQQEPLNSANISFNGVTVASDENGYFKLPTTNPGKTGITVTYNKKGFKPQSILYSKPNPSHNGIKIFLDSLIAQ